MIKDQQVITTSIIHRDNQHIPEGTTGTVVQVYFYNNAYKVQFRNIEESPTVLCFPNEIKAVKI